MKTYWFTVAGGPRRSLYEEWAGRLVRSGRRCGIEIEVLGKDATTVEEAKKCKIRGILDAGPCDRIFFIDADCFILNAAEHESVNGSMMVPPGSHKTVSLAGAVIGSRENGETAGRRFQNLLAALNREGLPEIASQKSPHANHEWMSGLIAGDADFMKRLAEEWQKWWRIMKEEVNEGEFERDQASYRFAYYTIAVKQHGYATIPREWCWWPSKQGFRHDVHIMHRFCRTGGEAGHRWNRMTAEIDAGFPSIGAKETMDGEFKKAFMAQKGRFSEFTHLLFGDAEIQGAEIGTWEGQNAAAFLENNPRLALVAVDMWDLHSLQPDSEYVNQGSDKIARLLKNAKVGQQAYQRTLRATEKYEERCTLTRSSSEEAASAMPDRSLNFAYIDADHTERGCRSDIRLWLPKIKDGGYLAGHDYLVSRFPGVTNAVNEFVDWSGTDFCYNRATYRDWIAGPITPDAREGYDKFLRRKFG